MSSNAYQSKTAWNPAYQNQKTNQNKSLNSPPIQTKLDNESELINAPEYKGLPSNSIIDNFQKSFNLSNHNIAPIQAKLTIGAPGDKYEQEADQVASQVVQKMNAPSTPNDGEDNSIQRKFNISALQRQEDREENLQAKFNFQAPNIQADFESTLNSAKGGGLPLDHAFRAKIEPQMGADFSGVRVHNDATADNLSQSIQAKAFTTGNHIFMKQGEYNPSSRGGQELLAHELTHTIQQGASSPIQRKENEELPPEKLEEIEEEGGVFIQGKMESFSQTQNPVIQRAYTGRRPLGGWLSFGMAGGALFKNRGVFHEHIFFEDGKKPSDIGFLGAQGTGKDDPKLLSSYVKILTGLDDKKMREAVEILGDPGEYSLFNNNCQMYVENVLKIYPKVQHVD